ncbi:MAG TPA: rhodanese-like domain-containing protein [Chloroflexia bacterium]|nr:rhodanese-like domain-containing protein [Chloroflexia bacterium]
MSQERPREKAPTRSTPTSTRTRPAPSARRYAPPPPPPRRDPFPFLMGGIIGALVVGLMVVIFILTTNNNGGGNNNPVAGVANTPAAPLDPSGQIGAPLPTEEPAPRMTMDEFKALYDDPAKRPFIVDVRPKAAYDEGHIAGAVSIPEAEVDVRIAEFPKDRLIVAYCQ